MNKKTFIIFICLIFLISCETINLQVPHARNRGKNTSSILPYIDSKVVIMLWMGENLDLIFGRALITSLAQNGLMPLVVYDKSSLLRWLEVCNANNYSSALLSIDLKGINKKNIYIPARILSYTTGTIFPLPFWPYIMWNEFTTATVLPELNIELNNLLISANIFDSTLKREVWWRNWIVLQDISNHGLESMAKKWGSQVAKELKKNKIIIKDQRKKDDFSWLDKYSPKKK